MTDLKPCPFCGGTHVVIITMPYGVKVQCFDCGASVGNVKDDGEYKTLASARKHHKDKAIGAWNRRKYEKQ